MVIIIEYNQIIENEIDEFRTIDAILNWGARFENRGSDISLKLRRNIACIEF